MFLLQALTPQGHEVLLIDGNAQPMDEDGIARYVREQNIGLVGIGAMTRMIAKAYRMADAIRAVGVLTRPKHWQKFIPFEMAHTPLKMTIAEAHAEVKRGWALSYTGSAVSRSRINQGQTPRLSDKHFHRSHVFPWNLFPPDGTAGMAEIICQNRRTIFALLREGFSAWRGHSARSASAGT
jgi:hypothetical protein